MWLDLIVYCFSLLNCNYRCVAPDNRGYGWTDHPSGVQNYSREKLAGDVKHLVQALGHSKCILVGRDWGGVIGYN